VLNLTDLKQSKDVQNLRYEYFVRHRAWVTCNGSGEESDHYDPFCQHLAVFQNDHILAYMRLLPWQPHTGFMLEHDFACLLSDEERASLIHDHSAELSRLVIAPAAQNRTYKCDKSHTLICETEPTSLGNSVMPLEFATPDGIASKAAEPTPFTPHVLELLLKLLYHVSRQQGITTFYVVVEPPLLKILQRKFGIPFKPIGKPYTFPDGTHTVAAFTTLAEIEESIKRRWPRRYDWYQRHP
jgi:N-acyl-L-homoserine lactone synthetase